MAITGGAALVGAAGVYGGIVTIEVVAYVALAATVVGAITHDSTLTKIGAGLGLAAGGSSLLTSAPSEAAAASSAGNAAGATGTASGAAAPTANSLNTAGVTSANSLTAPSAAELTNASGGTAGLSGASAGGSNTGLLSSGSQLLGATQQAPTTPTPVGNDLGANVGSGVSHTYDNPLSAYVNGAKTSSSDFMSKVMDGISAHPQLASGLMMVGGSALGGIAQANAQQQSLDFQKKVYGTQVANANAQPTLNMTVNPNANIYNTGAAPVYTPPQPVGIIQTAQRKA